ncbi:uncharacterized protein ACR2FA_005121 [Aphomia sociella]
MRKKLHVFLLFLLIISTNIAFGNGVNKTKIAKLDHAKHNSKFSVESNNDRMKRSLYDKEEKKTNKFNAEHQKHYFTDPNENKFAKESPFWGNRGKRFDPFVEKIYDADHFVQDFNKHQSLPNNYCKNCFPSNDIRYDEPEKNTKERREELREPFWGNRGRRSSEEADNLSLGPFWGNRGRRQDDDPFWGTRGRRQDDSPFWGNRGKRDDEPFWGNRGRRQDTPFWTNRGRRDVTEPFWGNRGRREDAEPFWGNRGRRQDSEPFWGNRGRRDVESFWGKQGIRKQELEESILDAINDIQGDIENLSRMRRSNLNTPFWASRARDSKIKNIFTGVARPRLSHLPNIYNTNSRFNLKASDPGTVLDNRMYAEEPHYILVERSSRSSMEDDPYFISRGKKYSINEDLSQTERDRRGAIEEIVKSVRNDPYYIARGKKGSDIKVGNSTALQEELTKAKDLICSTIELILIKNDGNKTKRDLNDNERDRRTILKKLAAQLQVDPYFVSRGKRSDDTNNDDNHLQDFINEISTKCA